MRHANQFGACGVIVVSLLLAEFTVVLIRDEHESVFGCHSNAAFPASGDGESHEAASNGAFVFCLRSSRKPFAPCVKIPVKPGSDEVVYSLSTVGPIFDRTSGDDGAYSAALALGYKLPNTATGDIRDVFMSLGHAFPAAPVLGAFVSAADQVRAVEVETYELRG